LFFCTPAPQHFLENYPIQTGPHLLWAVTRASHWTYDLGLIPGHVPVPNTSIYYQGLSPVPANRACHLYLPITRACPLGCYLGLSSGPATCSFHLGLSLCLTPRSTVLPRPVTCACQPGLSPICNHHPGLSTGLPPGPFVRACYLYLSPGGWGVTRVCTLRCHLLLSPGCHLVLSPGLVT
jgi:hypothetical protein